MFNNIAEKAKEVAKIKKAISSIRETLEKKKEMLSKKEEELEKMKEGIAIEEFLFNTNAKYIRLGVATSPESESSEEFGFVVVGHVAFLVWEKYTTGNEGVLYLIRDKISRRVQSVCLCGCGLDLEKAGKRFYEMDEIDEKATICKGFFAKPIIEICIKEAQILGISLIFSRHADYVGRIGDVHLHEITKFRHFVPMIGRNLLNDFNVKGGRNLICVG